MKDILAASVIAVVLKIRFGKKALHFIVITWKNEQQFFN